MTAAYRIGAATLVLLTACDTFSPLTVTARRRDTAEAPAGGLIAADPVLAAKYQNVRQALNADDLPLLDRVLDQAALLCPGGEQKSVLASLLDVTAKVVSAYGSTSAETLSRFDELTRALQQAFPSFVYTVESLGAEDIRSLTEHLLAVRAALGAQGALVDKILAQAPKEAMPALLAMLGAAEPPVNSLATAVEEASRRFAPAAFLQFAATPSEPLWNRAVQLARSIPANDAAQTGLLALVAGGDAALAEKVVTFAQAYASKEDSTALTHAVAALVERLTALTPAERVTAATTMASWAATLDASALTTATRAAADKPLGSTAPSLLDAMTFVTRVEGFVHDGSLTRAQATTLLGVWKLAPFSTPAFSPATTLELRPSLGGPARLIVAADSQIQSTLEGQGFYEIASNDCTGGEFTIQRISGELAFLPAENLSLPTRCTVVVRHLTGAASATKTLDIRLEEANAPSLVIGFPSAALVRNGQTVNIPLTYTGSATVALTPEKISLQTTGSATCGSKSVSNGTTATPTVTLSACTGNGTVAISVAAGGARSALGGSDSGAGPSTTMTVDNAAPTVSIGSPSDGDINSSASSTFTLTYAGATSIQVDADDIQVTTTGTAACAGKAVGGGTTATPSVTLSNCTGNGTVAIGVYAEQSTDAAGNADAGAGPSATVNVDNDAPTVSIGEPSVATVNSSQSATFAITYSGASSVNLTTAQVTVSGDATCSKAVSNGTTSNPTVTLSGCTGNGTVAISIGAGAGTDTAGNADAGAGPGSSVNVVNNRAPNAPTGADITEVNPDTTDTLHCTANNNGDPDGDTATLVYRWLKNDTLIPDENTATLAPANFAVTDEIHCEVAATDGTLTSAWAASENVTIAPDPTAEKLVFIGDARVLRNACQPLAVALFTSANALTTDSDPVTVTLSDNSVNVAFYSNADCSSSTTTAQIAAGQKLTKIYVKGSALESATLTASDGGILTDASLPVQFVTGFTNVTAAAGLATNFGYTRGGLKVEDFNRDGWLDFAEQESFGIWFNDHDGTFTHHTQDGTSDTYLWLDTGFYMHGFVDTDGDGVIDFTNGRHTWKWNGTHWRRVECATSGFATACSSGSSSWFNILNYNRDHRLDVLIPYSNREYLIGLFADTNIGTLVPTGTTGLPSTVVGDHTTTFAADLDRDGSPELITRATTTDMNIMRLNQTTGVFTAENPAAIGLVDDNNGNPIAFEPMDYDNDGDLDLLVGKWDWAGSKCAELFRNDSTPGSLAFVKVNGASGMNMCSNGAASKLTSADFEFDGDLDIAISASWDNGNQKTYLNHGNGTFQDYSANFKFDTGDWDNDINSIDYDNDGDLDMLVTMENNIPGVTLYRNDLNPGHFLRVVAVGTNAAGGSHWQAYGARVDLLDATGATVYLTQEVLANQGHRNQKPTRLVFGLSPHWGGIYASYKIRVTFPSGIVRTVDVNPAVASATIDGEHLVKTIRVLESGQ